MTTTRAPRAFRIRPANGNRSAWLLCALRPDGTESDSYGSFTTALSLDSLLAKAGPLAPRPGDSVDFIPRPIAEPRATRARGRSRRAVRYGQQEACACCGQDIEWHGRGVGWIDRGAGRECLPHIERGEVITPPKKAKHRPTR